MPPIRVSVRLRVRARVRVRVDLWHSLTALGRSSDDDGEATLAILLKGTAMLTHTHMII